VPNQKSFNRPMIRSPEFKLDVMLQRILCAPIFHIPLLLPPYFVLVHRSIVSLIFRQLDLFERVEKSACVCPSATTRINLGPGIVLEGCECPPIILQLDAEMADFKPGSLAGLQNTVRSCHTSLQSMHGSRQTRCMCISRSSYDQDQRVECNFSCETAKASPRCSIPSN
jgi:hypothetical protein